MKVICINNSNRPPSIPLKDWPDKGEIYTVVATLPQPVLGFGYVLEEIAPPADSGFNSYDAARFREATDDDLEAIEAVRELMEEIGEFHLV